MLRVDEAHGHHEKPQPFVCPAALRVRVAVVGSVDGAVDALDTFGRSSGPTASIECS